MAVAAFEQTVITLRFVVSNLGIIYRKKMWF